MYLQPACKREAVDASLLDGSGSFIRSESCKRTVSSNEGRTSVSISGKDSRVSMHTECLTIGSQVEVLSQDIGISGCWFRAMIIKRHKDKVKVQYQDIKDATNEAIYLEEWILASRIALPDAELGIRISGRTVIRPTPLSDKSRIYSTINVGSSVDAWWHDGWWEGIVVKKESEDKLHIYFPGEKQEMIFSPDDTRHSKEWIGNEWKDTKERPELASILSGLERKPSVETFSDANANNLPNDNRDLVGTNDASTAKNVIGCDGSTVSCDEKKPNLLVVVGDLSRDGLLAQLRWKSYGKRRHGKIPVHKVHYGVNISGKHSRMQTLERFFSPSSLKIDPDNWKYATDSLLSLPVVSALTSWVMSR